MTSRSLRLLALSVALLFPPASSSAFDLDPAGHHSPPYKIRVMNLNIREGFRENKKPEAPGSGEDMCNSEDDSNYNLSPVDDREPSADDPSGEETYDCSKELRNLAQRIDFLVHDETPTFSDYYPDVIAVQEANLDSVVVLVNELNERLPGARYTWDFNSIPPSDPVQPDPADEIPNCGDGELRQGVYARDSGIIYNAATVTWQDGGDVALKYTCGQSANRQKVTYRMAPFGLATEIATGSSVAVLSVHTLTQPRFATEADQITLWEQWARDMRAALNTKYPTEPRVIAGDFNNRMCEAADTDIGSCNKRPWWGNLQSNGYNDTVKMQHSGDLSLQWTEPKWNRRIDFIFYKGLATCGATADNEAYHGTKYVPVKAEDSNMTDPQPDTPAPQWDKYVTDHRPVFATVLLQGTC